MVVNDTYRFEVESLDHNGRGIVKVNKVPIFIDGALQKELVDIKITKVKKNMITAEVVNVITPSKDRIESLCPYFKQCGGCDLLHMNYDLQLSFKEQKVKEILKKFSNIDPSLIKPIKKSNEKFYYRNKITLKVEDGKIGYYKKKTNQIVPIKACKVAHPSINKIFHYIRNYLPLHNIFELVLRVSHSTDETMLVIKKEGLIDENLIIKTLGNVVSTIILYENKKYTILTGRGHITEQIGSYRFNISPDSFFQIHSKQTKILYDQIVEYASLTGSEVVLDLFCGTGTIGIYLSKWAKEVLGVEINRYAILDAYENRKLNNTNHVNFICKDVTNFKDLDSFDVAIIDPPRNGLDLKTISFLLKRKPKKVVYVSCNPITLARDLELLTKNYSVLEIRPIDMFPQSMHVECVCVMSRR